MDVSRGRWKGDRNDMGRNLPPGSDEAVEQGCTCPVMDNAKGKGLPGGMYWIDSICPLHSKEGWIPEEAYPPGAVPL